MKYLRSRAISTNLRPTPHGVGGLKSPDRAKIKRLLGPTPHGVGGLKLLYRLTVYGIAIVPPLTGWVD